MQTFIERMLYICLLVLFLGIGLALYFVLQFSNKLDNQLQALREQQDRREKAVQQIISENQKNTRYLECLINLHTQGVETDSDSCKEDQPPQPTQGFSKSAPSSPNTPKGEATTSPPSSDQGQQGQNSIRDVIVNTVNGIIKAVGL